MKRLTPLEYSTLKSVPQKPGVYTIYTDKTFYRLRGKTDIIYIGKANNLRRRIKTFWKGVRNARYRFERLQKAGFKLFYSFDVCNKPIIEEHKRLVAFEKKHLEVPPLNRSSKYI